MSWALGGGLFGIIVIGFGIFLFPWSSEVEDSVMIRVPTVSTQNVESYENGDVRARASTERSRTVSLADLQIHPEPRVPRRVVPRPIVGDQAVELEVGSESQTVSSLTHEQTDIPDRQDATEASGRETRVIPSRSLAENAYRSGIQWLRDGNLTQAAQSFENALSHDKYSHEARIELAIIQFSEGNTQKAIGLLNDGLELAPGYNNYRVVYARILERTGEGNRALDVLREAMIQLPRDADLLVYQGALATELNQYRMAQYAYRQLVEWRPDQGVWWLGLGYALELSGERRDAAEAYRQALRDPRLSRESRSFLMNRREELDDSW